MRKKNFKGKCTKMKLNKCETVARTYDRIQTAYAEVLDRDSHIEDIRCNVVMDDLEEGEYTSDFVCIKKDGEMMVRECTFRKNLQYQKTCKLLDASRQYWMRRGVTDWAIVVEKEEPENEEK